MGSLRFSVWLSGCVLSGCHAVLPDASDHDRVAPRRALVRERVSVSTPPALAASIPRRIEPSDVPDRSLPRHVILEREVVNARDLGGTPLAEDSFVAYDELYRGPPLAGLSFAGCSEFQRLGIRTVIDLRIEGERTTAPESACVSGNARIVSAPLPIPYSVSPQDYIADLDATESMAIVLRTLGDEAAYPIYFHCTWGRDRTGVVAAVVLRALGAAHADIMREYMLSASSVGAYPRSLQAVLDVLETRGGVRAYLRKLGTTDAELNVLQSRLADAAIRDE